jgi:hypothetical protein
VVVVENPYGGVVPDLVEELRIGRGYDLFRMSLYEGAAMGANMTVPYGAWMGSRIEDAYYPPHDLATEVQAFLAEHDDLFSRQTCNEVAVVFSIESNRELISRQDSADNVTNRRDESVEVPFRLVTAALADAPVPFDVVMFADGVTAPDRIDAGSLRQYPTVILPGCVHLTTGQARALGEYLDGGGWAVVVGELGENLPPAERDGLLGHENVRRGTIGDVDALLPRGRQLRVRAADGSGSGSGVNLGVNIQHLPDGAAAVHLVNYDYDREIDGVRSLTDVELTVELGQPRPQVTVLTSRGDKRAQEAVVDGTAHTVHLEQLGLYSIVVLSEGAVDVTATEEKAQGR